MDPQDDWILYGRFKEEGDLPSFHALFGRYKVRIFNLSYRVVRNREAAEDIAQEVLIKIYEKKVEFTPKARFFTWVYRVTVNASLDFIRKNKFVARPANTETQDSGGKEDFFERVGDPNPVSPSEAIQQKELHTLLRTEIETLPEELRVPILLYQFENLPYEEIARILKITTKAVERRLYHAKQRLRDKLSKYL